MTFRELAQPLRGIIPPMVSPLASADQLDVPGTERLVEHLVTGGVHGLFLLGTCGEGTSLSYRLRRELVDRVCRQVDGRIPVLVSITDTSYAESAALAGHAADAGADAVVVAPPYYLPIEQAELVGHVLRLANEAPLPVVLYNMPSLTNVAFEPASLRRLMDEESIVGIKDSSGDMGYFQKVRELTRARPDWFVLVGPEHLLTRAIALGGDGGVSGGANVWPQLFVRIYETAVAHQQDELAPLVQQAALLGQIYGAGVVSAQSVIKGLKAALSLLGICSDMVAPPLACLNPTERQQIEAVLRTLHLLPERDTSATRVSC
jgi:dihydrodipicolinate synthase/N-acetylneuraminate lyase